MPDPKPAAPQMTGPRFADMLRLAIMLGGMVEARLPSGRPIHAARIYNRRLRRARVFLPKRSANGKRR